MQQTVMHGSRLAFGRGSDTVLSGGQRILLMGVDRNVGVWMADQKAAQRGTLPISFVDSVTPMISDDGAAVETNEGMTAGAAMISDGEDAVDTNEAGAEDDAMAVDAEKASCKRPAPSALAEQVGSPTKKPKKEGSDSPANGEADGALGANQGQSNGHGISSPSPDLPSKTTFQSVPGHEAPQTDKDQQSKLSSVRRRVKLEGHQSNPKVMDATKNSQPLAGVRHPLNVRSSGQPLILRAGHPQ